MEIPTPPKQPTIKHECVLGASGSGKSHYIKTKILPKYLKNKNVLKIIIDPDEDYDYLKLPSFNLKRLNFNEMVGKLKEKRSVRIVIPDPLTKDELKEKFEKLDELYMFILKNYKKIYPYCKAKGMVLLIDEAHECGAHAKNISMPLVALLKRGRKRNIKVILATQRVAYFSTEIRSQCQIDILFRVGDDTDKDRYRKISGEVLRLLENSKKEYPYVKIHTPTGKILEKNV